MSAELIDVTKQFGSHVALDAVSLAIQPGEFVSIVGPSGCGKTTLLRLLAGFDLPTGGTLRIADREVSTPMWGAPPERRDIGMVFQTFALWPHMTVAQQVRFPLDHRRGLAADIAAAKSARVDEVLALTGLLDLRNRYPNELSGGQQQRVGLARAIGPRPRLLLMDEPLSALDAELRVELRREIQTLHQRTEVAVVYVTHDQTEALSMSDRVAVMRAGRIEQVGEPAAIYRRPETEFVARFVGRANLLRGCWDGDVFLPDAGGGTVRWTFGEVTTSLRANDVCPIRPEQLEIGAGTCGTGVSGTIRNALYNGRELHYTVDVDGSAIEVLMPAEVPLDVGTVVTVGQRS